jgi:hypothetical protein
VVPLLQHGHPGWKLEFSRPRKPAAGIMVSLGEFHPVKRCLNGGISDEELKNVLRIVPLLMLHAATFNVEG